MAEVTIRGLVNTTYLREGERATVEHTDTIAQLAERKLVAVEMGRGGYMAGPQGGSAPAHVDAGAEIAADGGLGPEDAPEGPQGPRRGASKSKWVEWLELNGVEVSDDDTKNDLIEKWMGRAVQG